MAASPVYATALGDRRFDDRLRANGPGALDGRRGRASTGLLDRRDRDRCRRPSAADRVTRGGPDRLPRLRARPRRRRAGARGRSTRSTARRSTFLNVPSFQPVRDARRGASARSPAGGRWARGSTASIATTRGRARPRASARPRALVRSVVAELDDLLARPGRGLAARTTRPATLPADWPAARRAAFAGDGRRGRRRRDPAGLRPLSRVPRRRARRRSPAATTGRASATLPGGDARPTPGSSGRTRPST